MGKMLGDNHFTLSDRWLLSWMSGDQLRNISSITPFHRPQRLPIQSTPVLNSDIQLQDVMEDMLVRHTPGMNWDMQEVYGQSFDEVRHLQDNPFLKIGFNGEDNCLGWGLAHLEDILDHSDVYLDQLNKDANYIRHKFDQVVFSGESHHYDSIRIVDQMFSKQDKQKWYYLQSSNHADMSLVIQQIFCVSRVSAVKDILRKTFFVVTDKSGQSLDSLTHLRFIESLYNQYGLDVSENLMILTDPGTSLESLAMSRDYVVRHIQLNHRRDIESSFCSPLTRIFLLPLAMKAPDQVTTVLTTSMNMNDRYHDDAYVRLGVFLYYWSVKRGQKRIQFELDQELSSLLPWLTTTFEKSIDGVWSGFEVVQQSNDLSLLKDQNLMTIRIGFKGLTTEEDLESMGSYRNDHIFDLDLFCKEGLAGLMLGLQRSVMTRSYLQMVA